MQEQNKIKPQEIHEGHSEGKGFNSAVIPKLQAIRVNTAGAGRSQRILWESNLVPYQFQREDIAEAQRQAGYHPGGYGCDNVVIRKVDDLYWKATWTCAGSCD